MVLFEAIALVPWLAFSAWVIATKPQRRLLQTAKVILWLSSVLVIVAVHWYVASVTRANAQHIADAILEYSRTHGEYPPNLQAIAVTQAKLKAEVGLGGYVLRDGKPLFFYATPYIPFETDHYDFERRSWVHDFD